MKASIRLSSYSRGNSLFQPCIHHSSSAAGSPSTLITSSSISVLYLRPACRNLLPTPCPPHLQQTRSFLGFFRRKRLEDQEGVPMSVADLLKNRPKAEDMPNARGPTIKRGDLASSSIFDKEEASTAPEPEAEEIQQVSPILARSSTRRAVLKEGGLLPDLNSFMRKQRIRQIRKRGRLTKAEIIARTEKEHLAKSHKFKTSLKKLGPLARQIAGKPLDHAITQMRFSPKKAAKSIVQHLEQAKNEAVYTKSMDPGKMYISQAWVGRGTPDIEPLTRARGRVDRMERPYTSISVILKETKTLERLAKEKEEKRQRKKLWVPVPNRPIYGQHQYYTW